MVVIVLVEGPAFWRWADGIRDVTFGGWRIRRPRR